MGTERGAWSQLHSLAEGGMCLYQLKLEVSVEQDVSVEQEMKKVLYQLSPRRLWYSHQE